MKAEDAQRQRSGVSAFAIARWLLLMTLLAAPLAFGATQPWARASLVFFSLLLFFLWGIGSVQQKILRVSWSPLYIPAALFLLLGAVQFWGRLTLDPYATQSSLISLVTVFTFFFIAGQILAGGSEKTWAGFGLVIAIYTSLLSVFAVLQYFSSGGRIYWAVKSSGVTFGPYVNRNHYAGLLEMLIPLAASYVISRPQKDRLRPLLGFGVLVTIASVLLSGSRGGFIALFTESLALLVVIFGTTPARNRRVPMAKVALGLVMAAAIFFWMDTGAIAKRLATIINLPKSSQAELDFGTRKALSLDCLRILRDHPWFGTGLGSFAIAYPRYQSFSSDLFWIYAHDDFAQALAETGRFGGAVIVGALVIFFPLAFRDLGQRLRRPPGWIQLGATLGCCGLLLHSLFDFNLHIPANGMWFAVCAAWATCPLPRPSRADTRL